MRALRAASQFAAGPMRARWLALYLAALPVMKWLAVPVAGRWMIAADALFPLVAIGILYRSSVVDHRRLRGFAGRLGLFLGAAAVSLFFADGSTTAWRALLVPAYLSVVAYVSALAASSASARSWLAGAWMYTGAAVAAAGVAGLLLFALGWTDAATNPFLFGYGSLPVGPYPRVSATFLNANMCADFLLVAWVLTLAAPRPSRWVLTLLGVALLATLSPGLGGLFLAGALMIRRDRPASSARKAALIAVAAVMLVVAATFPDTSEAGGFGLGRSPRSLAWAAATQAWAEQPWTGWGYGVTAYTVEFVEASGRSQSLRDAHNILLNVGGQTGIVGLAALLWLVVPAVARGLRRGGRVDWALAVAGVVTWGYHGLTGSFEETRHLWVLLGLAAASGAEPMAEAPSVSGGATATPPA